MPGKKNKKPAPERVLITRFSALGDVAIALPVIYDACRANPSVQFLLLTKPLPARLFINPPENLKVLPVETDKYKGISGLRRLYKEIRRKFPFDAVADLHNVLRTRVLGLFSMAEGIPVKCIDKERSRKRALTRKRHKKLVPLTPTPQRYRRVFEQIGIPAPPTFRTLFEEKPPVSPEIQGLTSQKAPGETWIGIAPFAAHNGKIYPLEKMEEVVRTLAKREGYRIFLFGGGKQEAEVLEAWTGPGVINVAAAGIGIENELLLISMLDTMLSMDSANMHLAGLTGTRTVAVWGATHPYTGFAGRTMAPEDTLQLNMPCRPCSIFGNKPCIYGDYHCLRSLPEATILERL